jgi:hypothetical protein
VNLILALLIVAAIVSLNIAATVAVMRDDYSERPQKLMQLALTWLIPMSGAILVLAVHRKAEPPSGIYRRADEQVGDDFGLLRPGARALAELLDDD